jgi:peroxiredoxin Q/BCP
MLEEGTAAPDFTLPTDDGGEVSLSDYRGKKVVLYFYPKDNTPGCTREACNFRDDHSKLNAAGAVVLGVSPDSVKSHMGFKLKFSLPFALLSDPERVVAKMYGALTDEGKIIRSTFVVDEDGSIAKVFPKVQVDGHSDEVLAALSEI